MTVEITEKRMDAPLFDLLATPARPGTVALFWLGQAGFAIRTRKVLIVIDAYLSNVLAEKYKDALFKHVRMMPPPIRADDLRGVDYLLASHAHSDHLDPGSVGAIMALNPECRLLCPRSARETALARGADPDRLDHPEPFRPKVYGGLTVELLPSAHETLAEDGEGNPVAAGFVLDVDGIKLYHSGDCVPYVGLAGVLAQRAIDAALLPVNGRDEYRTGQGIAGNFTVEEAADLCIAAGMPYLVPHHFGMFDFNTVPREDISRRLEPYAARHLKWRMPSMETYLTVSK